MCAAATAVNLFALESTGLFSLRAMPSEYDLMIVLTLTFIYCYFSEQLTSHLYEIDDIFYGLTWYQLPIKTQKLLIPTIQHSQQEFRLNGIGFVDCSLLVFGKV